MNLHHSDFIGILASIYKPKVYVELGLYEGETLEKVQPYCQKIYGIDIKSNDKLKKIGENPNVNLIFNSTNFFFENFNEEIDMIFIDADHCFDSAKRDFENSLKFLRKGGIIILHDTDPDNDKLIHPGYCGDSYKIVNYIENRDDLNILTIPIQPPGLSIVSRKNETRTQIRHSSK